MERETVHERRRAAPDGPTDRGARPACAQGECTSAVGLGRGQALDGSVSHDDEQDSDETTDQE